MKQAILVEVSLLLAPCAFARSTTTNNKPPLAYLPERARGGALSRSRFAAEPDYAKSVSYTLQVPLDWRTQETSPTFAIRYHVDASHFDANNLNAPIFVSMGGEGTSSGVSCSSTAIQHSALCVGVEHRFYGESLPESGATTSNYKLGLAVEQNLADTAAVVDAMRAKYDGGASVRPVVAVGGSYSGATCSWFRQFYPTHADACLSASGVVNTIVDFYEFDSHVYNALRSPDYACADALRNTTLAMQRLFYEQNRADDVKKMFNASNLIGTPLGDADFWYAVADGPQMMDQYGSKQELCDGLMQPNPDPNDDEALVQTLVDVINTHYGPDFAAGCFYDSECLKDVAKDVNSRSWRFQKCSEVAYLQRAPTSNSLRASALTLAALFEQCDYIFGNGTSAALQAVNAKFLNETGGPVPRSGAFPNTSNVFYTAFSDDPWYEASVQNETHPSLPYCMTTCDGCGHCGAGVPSNLTECQDESDAFVARVLDDFAAARKVVISSTD